MGDKAIENNDLGVVFKIVAWHVHTITAENKKTENKKVRYEMKIYRWAVVIVNHRNVICEGIFETRTAALEMTKVLRKNGFKCLIRKR